jgi:predicted nucleic acid-binding protein
MGLILDTSVLIAAEKRRFSLPSLFAAYPGERFSISAITASALLHGVERAQPAERKAARSTLMEQFLALFEVLDLDLAVARRHATLWATLEKNGGIIGPYDSLIAATALEYDRPLGTLNRAEFERVPALQLLDMTPFVVA